MRHIYIYIYIEINVPLLLLSESVVHFLLIVISFFNHNKECPLPRMTLEKFV